ncbi:MAG TPA: alpha-2-macroglobulin family protein, partial [Myxococcaceae bacterium]|nr:alpha-2-macroglobulin family protein [Myxococcaceae bacterium]
KITTHFSTERLEGWVDPSGLKGLVNLKNLFGTAAEDRRVAAKISLTPWYPGFRPFKDYTFFDPLHAKHSYEESLSDGHTDANGDTELELGLDRFEKATYFLTFTAQGYEAEGGRGVGSESAVLVSPMQHLVGYKADGDLRYMNKGAQRTVELIAIDPGLKRVAVSGLKAQLIEQRYVSVLTQQHNGTYRYQSVLKDVPLSSKDLSISDKGIQYALPTDQPGDFVLSVREGDDTELAHVPFSVVGRANLTRTLEKNAELEIKLSRADYAPGDEIELEIKAPYTGAGLITIERDRVFAWKWFKTTTTSTVEKISLPPGLEGNGYVNVAFVRGLDSPEIFMSPLSYGVMPFSISRAARINEVTLTSPDLSRPGEPYKIKYKAQKPGKAVVFAVDEGILQVAGYKTPDPLAFFFKKRALQVSTAQILDQLLPEFSGVKAQSAAGGDEGGEAIGKNLNPFKRKRDKPVAYWSGIVDVDTSERELTYVVPDSFNGSLRVMAVVVSPDSVGVASRKAIVRGPFVLSPNAPTFAAPGDEFEVSVGVSNGVEGSGKDAEVALTLKTSEHLEVMDQPTRKVKVSEGHETSQTFRVRAKSVLGSGTLTFVAAYKDKQSKQSVDMSVRPPLPYMTSLSGGMLRSSDAELPVTRKMY